MKNHISKKVLYCMFLFIVMLGCFSIKPTFAKFSHDYTTTDDAVGFSFHFDVGISNFEEYEEVRVDANSYQVFNVNVENSTVDTVYYGIWYKMIRPNEINNDIVIGRLEDNFTGMSGSLGTLEDKTASIIIKNNSVNDIIVAIGVNSSSRDEEMEYLNGKHLISGSYPEIDYIYDDASKKYVSSGDSNSYFMLNSIQFDYKNEIQSFDVDHKGVFQVEAWGASNGDKKGSYTSGMLLLNKNQKLYMSVGLENSVDRHATDVRLVENDDDSNIMIADYEKSYISGHYGSLASHILDEKLRKSCVTGMEDIACSYHSSSVIFDETKFIDSNSEMPSFTDNKTMIGNLGNGHVRLTPIVPTIDIPKLSVLVGEQLNVDDVVCRDSLGGCHIVRVSPEDTSKLDVGTYSISFMVSDDYGVVYRYSSKFDVVSS